MRIASLFTAHWFFALLVALISIPGQAALPATDGSGNPVPTLAPLIKKTTPAVVNIATSATRTMNNPLLNDPFFRHFFNMPPQQQQQQRKIQSAGSGVIINAAKGIVVTNYHVIEHADEIKVGLHDGRSFKAKLLGSDPEVDIAVLEIKAEKLTAIPFADSDRIEVGDFAIAIGNPFGLTQTVTSGIVSALGRSGLNMESYENFIQTDASINPGNSGGALINLEGKLIGINTAIIAPGGGNVGIGFAIPSNMAKNSIDQILQSGEVKRGQLGIIIQDITDDLAEAFKLPNTNGVLVSQVQEGSAADKAGVKSGDVILKVDAAAVNSSQQLRNRIGEKRIGDPVSLTLYRDGKTLTLPAKVGNVVAAKGAIDFSSGMAKQLQGAHLSHADGKGVRVDEVENGSSAMMAGLLRGDIIVSANKQPVTSLRELQEAIRLDSNRLLLQIYRGNMMFYLVIR
jgi:Do/DeqQ family serine protease